MESEIRQSNKKITENGLEWDPLIFLKVTARTNFFKYSNMN
jgi:hypothetical protein